MRGKRGLFLCDKLIFLRTAYLLALGPVDLMVSPFQTRFLIVKGHMHRAEEWVEDIHSASY